MEVDICQDRSTSLRFRGGIYLLWLAAVPMIYIGDCYYFLPTSQRTNYGSWLGISACKVKKNVTAPHTASWYKEELEDSRVKVRSYMVRIRLEIVTLGTNI